ncbi:hypothetical protein C8F04DRAFT_1265942 [Mycena alexandri]|uniref:Uncharacterized protein n=1 Tax=Mycena alexandri TaxID=1745969 RepID=A0AAD6SKA1_9AGAR|nr:hypothetical protein C8F04DRAFT_1265942 [Mycena alexandri]
MTTFSVHEPESQVAKALRRFSGAPPAPPTPQEVAALPVARELITGDPFLPPELEREIFELAAELETDAVFDSWRQRVGSTVLVLPRVCRRVKSWIEPFMYRDIVLRQSFNGADPVLRFLAAVDSHPPSFFATHVKHLYFDPIMPLFFVQKVLSVCTGVIVLGCHHPYSSLAPLIASLPLRRLLLAELTLPTTPEAIPPWAASLTHLGISKTLPADPRAAFAALPALTHLAVGYDALPHPAMPGMGAMLAALFSACPGVRCLILVTESKTNYKWALQRLRDDGFADARFYVHLRPVMDATWDGWWRPAPDMFSEAEDHLKSRTR